MTDAMQRAAGGALYSAISNAVVGIVHEYTGRGPTRARTSIRDDVVVVVLQETLLKAERSLIEDNKAELVAQMRRSFQQTMRADMSAAVAKPDRTRGDRLHERQPSRAGLLGRGVRAGAGGRGGLESGQAVRSPLRDG